MKCGHNKKTREDYKQQARVHKALANEGRLMIVDCLRDCECSVGELTRALGLDQSTVSKHLAVLLGAGIVENRKAGASIFYRLLTPCVLDVFACTSQVLKFWKR
ncbi:MAG: ArsR family transcriptional regulator [Myxococcales bacterium]|nr:MAG: ArsR family transcriptional regulator [Myxococcales bacterium]